MSHRSLTPALSQRERGPDPWPWVLSSVVLCSAVLLGLGLVGPCLTVVPRAGELTGWLRLLRPGELEPTKYSILGGIAALWRGGEPGLAAVLLGFSVVFPTLKLGAMGWGVAAVWLGRRPHAVVRWAGHLGKFSMLDVVVLGLLVLAVQALPGGSEAELGWGVWAFAASVGLGLVGSVMLGSRKAEGGNRKSANHAAPTGPREGE